MTLCCLPALSCRKLDDNKVDEQLRSVIRAFCEALVAALNKCAVGCTLLSSAVYRGLYLWRSEWTHHQVSACVVCRYYAFGSCFTDDTT